MAETESKHQSTPKKKHGKCKAKRSYPVKLNAVYGSKQFIETFQTAVVERKAVKHESEAVLYSDPYQACFLPNFIKEEQFLEGLKDELLDQIFHEKNNDLYKFQQTDDLRKTSAPHIKALRKLLCEDFLDWLKDVTGIPLTNRVDMTCSRYDHTDVLLCHDDELDTRRIAYILYLVPPWMPEDGGTLDLYSMDEHGQPKDIVQSLVPAWNSIAWFEVTEASHHQVSEVLNPDKTRLSINGWFHGPPVSRPERYVEPPLPLHSHISTEEDLMHDWINEIYLNPDVQEQIQEKFENDSEIELRGFLKDEKYHQLMEGLEKADLKWQRKGPPNKRNYCSLEDDDIPGIVQQCLTFLQSEAMFLTLSNLTGLKLHELAIDNDSSDAEAGSYSEILPSGDVSSSDQDANEGKSPLNSSLERTKPQKKKRKLNSEFDRSKSSSPAMGRSSMDSEDEAETVKTRNPRCRCEVRRWSHGCYTLVHDTDPQGAEFALDVMLFCSCKGWKQEYGGYTAYIAKGEDEELLSVTPAENSLALVYRDKDTLKFVKHINSKVKDVDSNDGGSQFCDLSLVFYE